MVRGRPRAGPETCGPDRRCVERYIGEDAGRSSSSLEASEARPRVMLLPSSLAPTLPPLRGPT